MPPVMDLTSLWDEGYLCVTIKVDCLLPTGIIIILDVDREATISEIKALLWEEAQNYPLYSKLKDKNAYVFMCISNNAEKIELIDESKLLCDIRPFQPMLKVVEKKGNDSEQLLRGQIGTLLGKGLHVFDNLISPEVSYFRVKMRKVCEKTAKDRDSKSWLDRALCLHSPELTSDPHLPQHLLDKMNPYQRFDVQVVFSETISYTVEAHKDEVADNLIINVLEKHGRSTGTFVSPARDVRGYVLKVCGREEYLLGGYMFTQYKYIRKMFEKGERPLLMLVRKELVLADTAPVIPPKNPQSTSRESKLVKKMSRLKLSSIWECEEKYALTIERVTNVHAEPDTKYRLRACLYHGPEPITDIIDTIEAVLDNECVAWDKTFTFNISLKNIPRMARLCIVISQNVGKKSQNKKAGTTGRQKKNQYQELVPIAWVNIPVFDYQDHLRVGHCTRYMWSDLEEDVLSEGQLNPIGIVEDNPIVQEALCLTIKFHQYQTSTPGSVLRYPCFEEVNEVMSQQVGKDKNRILQCNNEAQKKHLDDLKKIIDGDPLDTLHEQDKELVWRMRLECHHYYPHSLAKLLNCVQWNDHLAVAQMHSLLNDWKLLPPHQALELLDFVYADKAVRKFAVTCIEKLSDDELLQYLLQLVQSLKYESYLDCELVEFLLKRALYNSKIGHFFFWLLRSEMHIPSFGVRFGLILEAYCYGNISQLSELLKQVESLEKLRALSSHAKKEKDLGKAKDQLQNMVKQSSNHSALSNIKCTLDPTYFVGNLLLEKCTLRDSKMRPLWMVWKNIDLCADNVFVMYKQGDDLRQDMLTLQILHIMDNIWQEAGLDLRMNIYGCLPTGMNEGLIGIVTESETIANIQKLMSEFKIKAAFNKKCLYDWLQKQNPTPEKLEVALNEFSLSCAGYCVATYVLGVADRHSDNIMLKENGQLFHIDFGHFLGNAKKKLGIKRDRGPFVLTTEYVYVITRADRDPTAFAKFQKTCERAFMSLRKETNFLLALFLMMVNTGIPQLSGATEIKYLKGTLVPHMKEEEALKHFRAVFKNALNNSFNTMINNTFHNFAKSNV